MEEKDSYKLSKVTIWKIISGVLVLLLIISLIFNFTGDSDATTVQDQPSQQEPTVIKDINLEGYFVKGNENAEVTIIEYSDFSCPFCAGAVGENEDVITWLKQRDPTWTAPIPNIIKNYVDTGKVKLIFKYFPGHGTGVDAMKIALCAGDQNKFWDLHDLFFANQESIEDVAKLKELAESNGVDIAMVDECLDSGKYDSRLTEDTTEGRSIGVSGTPTFLVGNEEDGYIPVTGAQPYRVFEQVINSAL